MILKSCFSKEMIRVGSVNLFSTSSHDLFSLPPKDPRDMINVPDKRGDWIHDTWIPRVLKVITS